MKHLKQIHPNYHKLSCQFRHSCKREFTSVELLEEHVKLDHNLKDAETPSAQLPAINVATKCDMLSCGGRKFDNTQLLMRHINIDHLREPRHCIFEDCLTQFNAHSTSRNHFRIKHLTKGKTALKKKHLVNRDMVFNSENATSEHNSPEDSVDEPNADDQMDIEEGGGEEDTSEDFDQFLHSYADFMNRMCHVNYIPHKTMQIIASEYLSQNLKSMEQKESKLRAVLKRLTDLTDDAIDGVIKEVLEDDDMINAQKQLSTSYKLNQFIMEKFKYVAPKEIILNMEEVERGAVKEVVHYIPVIETFKYLLEDETFITVLEKEREKSSSKADIIQDIKDGSHYKSLGYFKDNPSAFVSFLYSDALEIANPLGAARGKHKIVQLFYNLANIPKSQRSTIDRMQLALIVKEKNIRKYGLDIIYKALIDDLKKLEEGIMTGEVRSNFSCRR